MGLFPAAAAFDGLTSFFLGMVFPGLTRAAGFAGGFFLTDVGFGDGLAFGEDLPDLSIFLRWAGFFVDPAFTALLEDFLGMGVDLGAALVFDLTRGFFFFTSFFILLPARRINFAAFFSNY